MHNLRSSHMADICQVVVRSNSTELEEALIRRREFGNARVDRRAAPRGGGHVHASKPINGGWHRVHIPDASPHQGMHPCPTWTTLCISSWGYVHLLQPAMERQGSNVWQLSQRSAGDSATECLICSTQGGVRCVGLELPRVTYRGEARRNIILNMAGDSILDYDTERSPWQRPTRPEDGGDAIMPVHILVFIRCERRAYVKQQEGPGNSSTENAAAHDCRLTWPETRTRQAAAVHAILGDRPASAAAYVAAQGYTYCERDVILEDTPHCHSHLGSFKTAMARCQIHGRIEVKQ